MTNVELSDAIAAKLSAKAAAAGLTLEAYIERLLATASPAPRLTVEELDRLLDEEATSSPSPSGTFSRAELYSDHD